MKALLCTELGKPDTLKLSDIDPPALQPGQVRIRVRACSANFPDTLIIQGLYQVKPELPFSPGSEVAGDIIEIGEGVEGMKIDDRVIALCGFGGFAEQVVVNAGAVIPMPDQMSYQHGASFLMTYGTSYHALKQRAVLKEGETVLVLGAAGGVGLTAVELAKNMGARVIAAASTEEKLALAASYGADDLVNYTTSTLKDEVKRLTGGAGVDVLYDPVGGDLFEPAFRTMAWNGRALIIGFVGGIPKLPLNLPLLKGSAVVGVFWGAFTAREPAENRRNNEELLEMYLKGNIKPHVSKQYALADAANALQDLIDRKALGKLVVEI